MKRFFCLCLLLLLVSCQSQDSYFTSDSSHIKEAEVVRVLQENGVELEEVKPPQESIFGSKLKSVKPGAYELSGKLFFIYEFRSEKDRMDGQKEFAKKTETMDLVSFKTFEKRNILIFYVHEQDLNSDAIPFEIEIQKALDSIIEG